MIRLIRAAIVAIALEWRIATMRQVVRAVPASLTVAIIRQWLNEDQPDPAAFEWEFLP